MEIHTMSKTSDTPISDATLHLRIMIRCKLKPKGKEHTSMMRTFHKAFTPYQRKQAKAQLRRRMTNFLDTV